MITDETVEGLKRCNALLEQILSCLKEEFEANARDREVFHQEDYYEVEDLVKKFNVSRSTIYRWGQLGFLPKVSVGHRLLFPKKVVEGALKRRLETGNDWFEEIPTE